jgi:hypothetical protein
MLMAKVNKLIYLASPYTHPNKKIMKTRWIKVCKLSAKLLKKGIHNICPIASSEPIARYGHLYSTLWKDWEALDTNYLKRCDEIYISVLDREWYKSIGMRAELEYALANNIPARLVDRNGNICSKSNGASILNTINRLLVMNILKNTETCK